MKWSLLFCKRPPLSAYNSEGRISCASKEGVLLLVSCAHVPSMPITTIGFLPLSLYVYIHIFVYFWILYLYLKSCLLSPQTNSWICSKKENILWQRLNVLFGLSNKSIFHACHFPFDVPLFPFLGILHVGIQAQASRFPFLYFCYLICPLHLCIFHEMQTPISPNK